MQIVKKILIGIAALIGLFLIAAALTPRKYTVSVSETINKPKQEVFDYVKILKNQENYSVWVMEDPNSKLTYTGTDGTVGAGQAWDSQNENVGAGSMVISAMTDERIDIDLNFIRPFESKAKSSNTIKAINENQTLLTTEFYGDDAYPMNFMGYWMGRGYIEEAEKKNLQNIKNILEK
jgi:hypothetical protein